MSTNKTNQISLIDVNYTTTGVPANGESLSVALSKLITEMLKDGFNFISTYNASTNQPPLSNATIEPSGNFYIVTTAGTVDFGAGPITFALNDTVYSNGTTYQKGNPIQGQTPLADGQINIGQPNGLGSAKTLFGDLTVANTGETSLVFQQSNTPSAFNYSLRGGGRQVINVDTTIDITQMIIGRIYMIKNSDTQIHTLTFTGNSGSSLEGGDALTSGLTQKINAAGIYYIRRQDALSVTIW